MAVGLPAVAFSGGAPWFIWAIWGPAAAAILHLLPANPVSGLRIERSRLILSPGRIPRAIALGEVEHALLTRWSDSVDAALVLRSGETVQMFSGDVPPVETFAAELAARGVRVLLDGDPVAV